ncbi:aminotransferase class V-fold PLP-dependent enzyme [Corynebacterium sp. 335C]
MAFDVPVTRGAYTSLSDGWTYLNGVERAQIPERVSAAVATAFRTAPKKLAAEPASGSHARSQETGGSAAAEMTRSARRSFADVAGCRAQCVALGPSRMALMNQLCDALSRRITLGSEIVITRTGRPSLREPLRRAADMYGARVRVAEAELSTGYVPAWQFDDLVNESTRVVVVPAADPHVGTVAPVREIADRVHARSRAWVLVDATDYAAHRVVDIDEFGADAVLLDATAWGGPDVAALAFRSEEMLERLHSISVRPDARGVARIETSTVAPGLLGGVSASVHHLAEMDRAAHGRRRARIERAMPQVADYLSGLTQRLVDSLSALGAVHVLGVDEDPAAAPADRIGRVAFCVEAGGRPVDAADVVRRLLDNGVVASAVRRGESALLEAVGVFEAGGAVCVGLQPFNTPHDVDQLVRAVASFG